MSGVCVHTEPTPNPNALKFILDRPVKREGSSTYKTPMECGDNLFAVKLFTVRGVDQLHFFDHVITVTKFGFEEWGELEGKITEAIHSSIGEHDPDYFDPDPEAERRASLSPALLEIEEILDRTIRPGLQGDGGDIEALSYDDNVLLVRYRGACDTCPSAEMGTLEAIKSILRDQYNPAIEVYIAPEF